MGSTGAVQNASGAAGPLSSDVVLMYLADQPHQEWITKIHARYPGLEIRWVLSYADGARVPPETYGPEIWDGVTLMCCWWFPPPAELMSKVKFVQLTSAGTDPWVSHASFLDPNVVFCNGRGTNPPQIAEWVMGTWLANQHNLYRYHDYMKQGLWENHEKIDVTDSLGRRIGILGYGAIGREVARVAKAFNMEIYAYTHSVRPTPESRRDDSFCVPGTGDPEGLLPSRWFHGGRDAVDDFLGQDLDLLVVATPLTEFTSNLISHKQFDILSKKKTFLSNIGRGKIVNTEALAEALHAGKIRGAAVDVTDPEPLPKDHSLWNAPNLLVTPHVAWQTTNFLDRNLQLMEANLENLAQGKPLLNEVKRTASAN